MVASRSEVASDLLSAWRETRKRGWRRALEPDEAQALLEHIDELAGQIDDRDREIMEFAKVATEAITSQSQSLNRQDALTRLLYMVGYTPRPYDRHGIIPTRRDPFVGGSCGRQLEKVAKPRHQSTKRKARR